jgi:hypothetical protein
MYRGHAPAQVPAFAQHRHQAAAGGVALVAAAVIHQHHLEGRAEVEAVLQRIDQPLDAFVDLIDREGGLRIIREWNPDIWRLVPLSMRPDRGGNGSVLGFVASEQTHLFDDFAADPYETDTDFHIDQLYITLQAANRKYWPEGWCASFRRSCVPHWPLNLIWSSIRKSPGAKMFIFHGTPNPTDMIADGNYRWGTKWRYGFGPVKWVQDYWRKYTREA